MSIVEVVPHVPVNDPSEPEDACSYCCRPDGKRVTAARNSFEQPYRVDGAKIVFVFMLCELCRFARHLFPNWDARMQAERIRMTVVRLRERYA